MIAELVAVLVVAALFTPTWVVGWQMWSCRLSREHRTVRRPVRPPVLVVPQPRRPT